MNDDAFPDALPHQYRLHWYVLERVLGQGGFGITYLARDTNLGRQVAIKEYLPGDVAQRRPDASVRPRTEALGERYRWGLERFIGEAQTLAHFDHANIVRVLAVFEANDTAYMVMRFEEGDNLASLLEQRGALPEAELLRILLPILDGLQLVHDAHFIHRDIKPENIHIRRDGGPVLLDFGSARQSANRTHSMTVLVARGYAPLEQYYGDPDSQGAWSDIYSLAATCYRAIAGKAPADALERVKGVLGSVREVLAPAIEVGRGRYSERLLKAVDHALELSEKDRPQSIAAWRQELVGASMDTPAAVGGASAAVEFVPPAEPPKTKPPPRSSASRLRRARMLWAAGGAAGAAVAIAIFAGIQYQQSRDDQRQQEQQRLLAQQRLDDQNRQRQDEARLREEDRARRDAEERQRLLARLEEQQRQVEARQERPRPAPRLQPDAAGKAGTVKQAAAQSAPLATPEPQKAESVPAPVPPERELEAAAKQAVAPPRQPAAADLLDKAESALGRGDYAAALPVVKRLASAGDARGQALMGRLYESGLGMPRNVVAAYMWYSLAARGGNAAAKGMKERAAGALQPAEIRQADHAVDRWQPRNDEGDAVTR